VLAARAVASNGKKGKTQSRIIPDQVALQLPHRTSVIIIPEEKAKTPDSEILVLEEQVTDIIPEEEAKMDSGILVLEEQVTDTPAEEKAKTPDLEIPVSVGKAQKDGKTNRLEKLTPIVLL
jgi:hypothetical protein